jgi:hypothetical protein
LPTGGDLVASAGLAPHFAVSATWRLLIGGADREAGRKVGGWRTSTHSDANGGNCVEVAYFPRVVRVRETKDRDGATLTFSAEARTTFTRDLLQHPCSLRAPLA